MYLQNYEIRKQISHGHFGAIYEVADRQTGEILAVKIQMDLKTNEKEAQMLLKLQTAGYRNFPFIKEYGIIGESGYIIMEKLGLPLNQYQLSKENLKEPKIKAVV